MTLEDAPVDYCFFSAGNSDDLAYGWHVYRAPYGEGHFGPYGTRAAAIAQREAYVRQMQDANIRNICPDKRAEHLMFGHDIAQRKARGTFASAEQRVVQNDPLGEAIAESEKPLPAWTAETRHLEDAPFGRDREGRAYKRSAFAQPKDAPVGYAHMSDEEVAEYEQSQMQAMFEGIPISADDQRHLDAARFGFIPNTWKYFGPGEVVFIAVLFFVMGCLVRWPV